MRWLCVLVVIVCACTPAPVPQARPTQPGRADVAPTATPPTQLPAAEPVGPSLAAFRRRAAKACDNAMTAISAAPLDGDPLRPGARPRHVEAAIAHYRTMSAAWTAAAEDLWDFGTPPQRIGEQLITSLDTVGQYSSQTAELLAAGDHAGAQAGVSAVDSTLQHTNSVTRRLGIGRLDDCGARPARLRNAARVQVTAYDFAFTADTPRAGPTRFVLRNDGSEPHHVFVVRLREQGTVADAVRADRFEQRPGDFLAGAGQTSPVAAPGETVNLDVRLQPGVYGLLCFVASDDGTPHAYKGMATEVIVSR